MKSYLRRPHLPEYPSGHCGTMFSAFDGCASVFSTADIIDTWVYRIGLVNMQYSLASCAGLLKSVVSLIMISASYLLARKFADYRIF